jgi:hypothetical protein
MDDEVRDWNDDDDYSCPHCGAVNPEFEELVTPGFTGAPIYTTTWKCCGKQDVDADQDNLGWVK